jgi:hypothetical protein
LYASSSRVVLGRVRSCFFYVSTSLSRCCCSVSSRSTRCNSTITRAPPPMRIPPTPSMCNSIGTRVDGRQASRSSVASLLVKVGHSLEIDTTGRGAEVPSSVRLRTDGNTNGWSFWKLELEDSGKSCVMKEDEEGSTGREYGDGNSGYWIDGDDDAPASLVFDTCNFFTDTPTVYSVCAYTATGANADTPGSVTAKLQSGAGWSAVVPMFTGATLGSTKCVNIYYSDDRALWPTTIELAIDSTNAWGFWKVTIDGCIVVQYTSGAVGAAYTHTSSDPEVASGGGYWIDGGHCTLHSLCTVLTLHYTRFTLYSLYTVLTIHCTHYTLRSLYTALTMHCTQVTKRLRSLRRCIFLLRVLLPQQHPQPRPPPRPPPLLLTRCSSWMEETV